MRCYLANEGDSVGQGSILYTRSVSMNAVVDNVSVMLCMSMTLLSYDATASSTMLLSYDADASSWMLLMDR